MRISLPSGKDIVIWKGGYQIIEKDTPHPREKEQLPVFRFGDLDLLFAEVTDSCNFKCIHCYNGPYRTTNIMYPEYLDFSLRTLKAGGYRFKVIQITGGEPTTHPELEELFSVAVRYVKKLQLFTNGSLLDNIIDILSDYRDVLTVRVSFYSFDKDLYTYITRSDYNPERILENILLLHSRSIRVRVEVPLIPGYNDSRENIERIKQLFNRMNVPVRFSYIINYGWGLNLPKPKKTRAVYTNWYFAIPSLQGYNECWATHLAIDPKLNVYPCIFAREYILGNLRKDNIEKIKENHRKVSQQFGPDSLSYCSSCDLKYVCKRCPPRASVSNTLGMCEAFCNLCST